MKPHELNANALAKALRLDAPRISDIVREKRGITPSTALRLARYFGTTPELWMNLQVAYDLSKAKADELEQVEKDVTPIGEAA